MNHKQLYKHLTDEEEKRLSKWLAKHNQPHNSISIQWEKILTPSDELDPRRKKAINEARIASAERYARESRTGKSNRSRYGGKKREVSQVSRKKLQEEERRQRN